MIAAAAWQSALDAILEEVAQSRVDQHIVDFSVTASTVSVS
jgi:hypothetical protein